MDVAALTLRRGDIVLAVSSGNYGKPRPALVVQSDLFNATHASLTVCPVTSSLVEAPLYRIMVNASRASGLERQSQVMVDKMQTLRRDRIRERIGKMGLVQMQAVERALRIWLRL